MIQAKQVTSLRVHVGERASAFSIETDWTHRDPLLSIVLDEPGFIYGKTRKPRIIYGSMTGSNFTSGVQDK